METTENCKTKKLKRKEKNGKFFQKLEKIKYRKKNWKKAKKKINNLTICLWKQIVGPHVVALRPVA